MKIINIIYMNGQNWACINGGDDAPVKDIIGNPRKGSELELIDNIYYVKTKNIKPPSEECES